MKLFFVLINLLFVCWDVLS